MSAVYSLHIDNKCKWLNTDDKVFLARVIHMYGKHLLLTLSEKFPLTPIICQTVRPLLDIHNKRDDTLL